MQLIVCDLTDASTTNKPTKPNEFSLSLNLKTSYFSSETVLMYAI